MGSALFRIFRWSSEFSPNAELASAAVWVKLHGLDPCFFRSSFLREICRGIGRFLKVDKSTLSLANPAVARVCVEVDLAKPLVQGIWVGSEKRQKWVAVDYEGRVDYCSRCKKHGHIRVDCRRLGREPVERVASPRQPAVVQVNAETGLACQGGVERPSEVEAEGWTVVQRKRGGECRGDSQGQRLGCSGSVIVPSSDQAGQGDTRVRGIQGRGSEGDQEQGDLHCLDLAIVGEDGGCQKESLGIMQGRVAQVNVPRMVIRNVGVQSPFLRRMQDSIDDCMVRMFEQEKMQSQSTMYRRMLSVDDSALGCSSSTVTSQPQVEEGEGAEVEPLQICFTPGWQSGRDEVGERLAQLRFERDQSRRTTRSAAKLKSSQTS